MDQPNSTTSRAPCCHGIADGGLYVAPLRGAQAVAPVAADGASPRFGRRSAGWTFPVRWRSGRPGAFLPGGPAPVHHDRPDAGPGCRRGPATPARSRRRRRSHVLHGQAEGRRIRIGRAAPPAPPGFASPRCRPPRPRAAPCVQPASRTGSGRSAHGRGRRRRRSRTPRRRWRPGGGEDDLQRPPLPDDGQHLLVLSAERAGVMTRRAK